MKIRLQGQTRVGWGGGGGVGVGAFSNATAVSAAGRDVWLARENKSSEAAKRGPVPPSHQQVQQVVFSHQSDPSGKLGFEADETDAGAGENITD